MAILGKAAAATSGTWRKPLGARTVAAKSNGLIKTCDNAPSYLVAVPVPACQEGRLKSVFSLTPPPLPQLLEQTGRSSPAPQTVSLVRTLLSFTCKCVPPTAME